MGSNWADRLRGPERYGERNGQVSDEEYDFPPPSLLLSMKQQSAINNQ